MRYGILDTQDNTWIGNDKGPILFDTTEFEMAEALAQVAAQTLETQAYGTDLGCHYRSREYPELPVRYKGDIPVKMDSLTALRRVEGDR